jgi:flagellar biosynthesis/type III secretory pathway protein FliH
LLFTFRFKLKLDVMYAHEIMLEEAKERGFQRGFQEGFQEGVEIVAIKFWQNNIQPSEIARILELPIERVEFLIAQLEKGEAETPLEIIPAFF